jgi:hypothetical protein
LDGEAGEAVWAVSAACDGSGTIVGTSADDCGSATLLSGALSAKPTSQFIRGFRIVDCRKILIPQRAIRNP